MNKKLEPYLLLYHSVEIIEVGNNKGELLGWMKTEMGLQILTNCSSNQPYWTNSDNIQYIVLRSLSDMTEEEDKECHNIMFGEYAEKVKKQNIIHYEGEKIRYLLSKGFDLFNLIESGLAIDKTKLK